MAVPCFFGCKFLPTDLTYRRFGVCLVRDAPLDCPQCDSALHSPKRELKPLFIKGHATSPQKSRVGRSSALPAAAGPARELKQTLPSTEQRNFRRQQGCYSVVRKTTAVPFLDATRLRWPPSPGTINKSPKRNSWLVSKETVPQITWKIENFGSAFAGRG